MTAAPILNSNPRPPEPVLEQVDRAGLLDRVFFWSFNRDFLVDTPPHSALLPESWRAARTIGPLEETIADFDANIVEFIPDARPRRAFCVACGAAHVQVDGGL